MDAICRNCGNSGTGFDGSPCPCKLPPAWQLEVGRLREQPQLTRHEERTRCARLLERAAKEWPDNPTVRAVLKSLAAEIRTGE
jgi:hypothetical protein